MPKVVVEKEIRRETQLNDGTIEYQAEPVFVFVHCYNEACPSYHNLQQKLNNERKVPGVREETLFTYADRGGDMPGHENSHVRWFPANPEDATCPDCGNPLNVSEMASYVLQQYGVSPGFGLKGAEKAAAQAAAEVRAAQDDEITDLKGQIAELTRAVSQLNKPAKRPPGRPKGSKNKPKNEGKMREPYNEARAPFDAPEDEEESADDLVA